MARRQTQRTATVGVVEHGNAVLVTVTLGGEILDRRRIGARESLEALAAAVPVPIASIAIRECPKLRPTTEERIADNRAQTIADSVMYREALATAAEARGWSVHWYDREGVFRDAAAALGREDADAFLHADGPIDRAALADQAQACGSCSDCGDKALRDSPVSGPRRLQVAYS